MISVHFDSTQFNNLYSRSKFSNRYKYFCLNCSTTKINFEPQNTFVFFFSDSEHFSLFRQSIPTEFHDGFTSHNGSLATVISRQPTSTQNVVNRQPMSSVVSVISKQPTSPQNYLSFPITLPSSMVLHPPNYFVSNKIFAKNISTQTVSNFPCPLISRGGRHCLSVVYRNGEEEESDDGDQTKNNVDKKVNMTIVLSHLEKSWYKKTKLCWWKGKIFNYTFQSCKKWIRKTKSYWRKKRRNMLFLQYE